MQFRSQTDEQLAAKWDPYPWLDKQTKSRYSYPGARISSNKPWTFAPRVECIPSRDPLPYVDNELPSLRLPVGNLGMSHFDPRPEYARPPVNRVLVEVRGALANPPTERKLYRSSVIALYLRWLSQVDYDNAADDPATSDEIEHARKVLTRLAALE
jgi:hypothetical protein